MYTCITAPWSYIHNLTSNSLLVDSLSKESNILVVFMCLMGGIQFQQSSGRVRNLGPLIHVMFVALRMLWNFVVL